MDICKDHGIEFIGPTSQHINIMGDKSTARDTMKAGMQATCKAAADVLLNLILPLAVFVQQSRDTCAIVWMPAKCRSCLNALRESALACWQAAGVPTVPGSDGLIKDDEEAVEVSQRMGFPIMIKATAGGGGRGMRLAMTEKEFLPLLQQAAQVAFLLDTAEQASLLLW